MAGLEDAGPGDVTFLHNPKYAARLAATRASAVIADDRVDRRAVRGPADARIRIWRLPTPSRADAAARPPPGISPLAVHRPVGRDRRRTRRSRRSSASGRGARIGARVVAGIARRRSARASDRRRQRPAGARLGAGRRRASARVCTCRTAPSSAATASVSRSRPTASHQKIPQVGRVVIEDDVEIGALCGRRSAGRRRDAHRPRHEDRQPRAGRPRRAHRPARADGGPVGHRGQHDAGRRRRHGRAVGRDRTRRTGRRREGRRQVGGHEGRRGRTRTWPAFRPSTVDEWRESVALRAAAAGAARTVTALASRLDGARAAAEVT